MDTVLVYEDVHARVLATRAAQQRVSPTWVWKEKTLAGWDTLLTHLADEKAALDDTNAAEDLIRGELTAARNALHETSRQVIGMLKVQFRNDPAKLQTVTGLRAVNGSLAGVKKVADALVGVWQQTDPDGTYAGLDLNAYTTLRATVTAKETAHADVVAAQKQARQSLRARVNAAHKDSVAWYAVATLTFGTSTPDGQFIRANIPTQR